MDTEEVVVAAKEVSAGVAEVEAGVEVEAQVMGLDVLHSQYYGSQSPGEAVGVVEVWRGTTIACPRPLPLL